MGVNLHRSSAQCNSQRSVWTAVLAILAALAWWSPAMSQSERTLKPAPNLEGGVAWLNCSGPIKLADLRGKIVVLDFWTFCCINCIHTLPDIEKLEQQFQKEVVVIGVHSAKFDNEKNTDAIRKAILRYRISHPVVNDAEMKIWTKYGADSWPTLAVIDPEGNYLGKVSGEGQYELLKDTIQQQIAIHDKKGTIDRKMRRFDLARFHEQGDTPLFFPGKVLADAASRRLFIADSTHNRIVVTDMAGKFVDAIGGGEPGYRNGSFESAQFDDPQGLALRGDSIFVADRKNHSIRRCDFATRSVTTIAGTGHQNRNARPTGGQATAIGLNSPWDLQLIGDTLFIAMAGHHQIWSLNLQNSDIRPHAGSGKEDVNDGALANADLAQPSGITTDGKSLFVADSESSTVRSVDIDPRGNVATLVGIPGRRLFNFGDVDGMGDQVRLQHALGVVYHAGAIYVADTYNSKIKIVDPVRRTCMTLAGPLANGQRILNEPGGLSIANGKLYVADTNAHRIQVMDLATKEIKTLPLSGFKAPARQQP